MPDEDRIVALSQDDYQDYEFVLAEIEKRVGLSLADQIDRLRRDPWGSLNGLRGPNGSEIPLSREAKQRFVQIVRRGLENLGPSALIHRVEKVVEELKREYSTLLFAGFVPAPGDAHDLFTSAVRRLEQGYQELTYFVPCSVVAERSYPAFEIGPVTFVLRERFFVENETAMKKAIAEFDLPGTADRLETRMRSFYAGFQWIASITVPACDPELLGDLAHLTTSETGVKSSVRSSRWEIEDTDGAPTTCPKCQKSLIHALGKTANELQE